VLTAEPKLQSSRQGWHFLQSLPSPLSPLPFPFPLCLLLGSCARESLAAEVEGRARVPPAGPSFLFVLPRFLHWRVRCSCSCSCSCSFSCSCSCCRTSGCRALPRLPDARALPPTSTATVWGWERRRGRERQRGVLTLAMASLGRREAPQPHLGHDARAATVAASVNCSVCRPSAPRRQGVATRQTLEATCCPDSAFHLRSVIAVANKGSTRVPCSNFRFLIF